MKRFYSKYISPLFFTTRFFTGVAAVVLLFTLAFFYPWMDILPRVALGSLVLLAVFDYLLLYTRKEGMFARRITPERLSNGDDNSMSLYIENRYGFPVHVGVIDEIPFQFQKRDIWFRLSLGSRQEKKIEYRLRPTKRGGYSFGKLNVFTKTPLGLLMRRYRFDETAEVPVYPSYLQMRKYQLLAISNRLSEIGIKKTRRIGHSMEFEQIKEYVQGDDYRTVNWKATARRGQLMVNHYTDEKSQQIYCIINKGRMMKMPFEGLSLLDYAINASLVLSNVALLKQDKAGVITFSEELGSFLPADKRATQMNSVLEVLYNQKTRYLESDFEKLYTLIRNRITQRSLLVLFTNFESMSSLQRELPFLRKIARYHLLLVVFFENTEIRQLVEEDATDIEGVYTKTIAEKFIQEKRMIVKELQKYGILSILTAPQNVTVNTVNKYLELKTRQAI
ncbi:MAG TPA: DUF58 domain-containing protein [Chitinophagaceae bacterium]|jgi:uncharacterized protein (DUF58 family)